MRTFDKKTFRIATVTFVALMVPSLLAAFGEDEGTLNPDSLWMPFVHLFYILRFPTHTLLWTLVCKGGATAFFGGLLINCAFYGLVTERLTALFRKN